MTLQGTPVGNKKEYEINISARKNRGRPINIRRLS
jgi:hypothetical protein